MKITISKILILAAIMFAVPVVGGSAVYAAPGDPPIGPTLDAPTEDEQVPPTEDEPVPPGNNNNGGNNNGGGSTEASKAAVCEGIALTGGECDDTADAGGLDDIIQQAILVLSIVIGIVCIVMIMIGGLKYITSAGDANSLSSAKNTILYAIIGLVIVALAQTIVRFVLSKL